MWIEVWNQNAKVTKSSQEERSWLNGYLSIESSTYQPGGGRGTNTVRLLQLDNTFPSGFVPHVKKAAALEGYSVEVLDHRTPPVQRDQEADLGWLRDYQLAAIDSVERNSRGILWLPTGAGKTEVAVGLTRAFPVRWGFFTHRTNLMDQSAARYELRSPGVRAGRIGEGMWDVPEDAMFTAATFQTVHKMLESGNPKAQEWLQSLQGIIIDECHVVAATTFWNVAMSTPNAYYRIGLSGTPMDRPDQLSILTSAVTGAIIHRIRASKLVELGVLARPRVRMATVVQQSHKPTFQGVYGECIVRSNTRNDTLVSLAKRAAKPSFIFVKEMAHGKELIKKLGRAGVNAEFVNGTHSLEYRKSMVKRLVQGHFDVLICSVIFQEGVDVPELRSVIVGSGGKSVIATLQRLGRGMRVERDKDGNVVKSEFEVYDIADKGNKWLEKHTAERLRAYTSEEFETVVEPPTFAVGS